jgi:hypothetical protein
MKASSGGNNNRHSQPCETHFTHTVHTGLIPPTSQLYVDVFQQAILRIMFLHQLVTVILEGGAFRCLGREAENFSAIKHARGQARRHLPFLSPYPPRHSFISKSPLFFIPKADFISKRVLPESSRE